MRHPGLVLIIIFIFLSSVGRAQNDPDLSRQLVEIADEILNSTFAYEQAREQYLAAVEADPNNIRANYMAGEMFLVSVDKPRAKTFFEKAYSLDPNYRFDLLFKIGLANHYGLEFDDAISFYNQYLDKLNQQPDYDGEDKVTQARVERKIYECGVGKDLVAAPRRVSIRNLGPNINTEYDDYAPVTDANENMLIFTSRRRDGNLSEDVHTDNLPFEDMFMSVKDGQDWGYANNVGANINTPSHDSNLALSHDGNQLYVYNSDVNDGDIFISNLDADGTWSAPQRVPEPVNSEFNENGVSVTSDGRLMFFSSNRPGGEGGFDIYMSEHNNSGGWRRPVNLGPIINTPFDEEGPVISFDDKTLYFSSQGGRGMGGFDIFKSEYDSANSVWGLPENMGHPINTPDEDVHFTPTQDGFRAYYATTRDDGFGETDIYEITFVDDKEKIEEEKEPVEDPPAPVVQPVNLRVQVLDDATGDGINPMDARISLTEISTNIIVNGSSTSNGMNFRVRGEQQSEYQLSVEKDGFAFYNQKITLPAMDTVAVNLERIIRLRKIESGLKTVLRNLYFDFDKAELKPQSLEELTKLERMMTQNASLNIGVVGHTDDIGTEEYNLSLSKRRAKAVMDYLTSKGIDPRRIKTGGLGARFPLATNDDEKEGRELNRRVEMVVLSN